MLVLIFIVSCESNADTKTIEKNETPKIDENPTYVSYDCDSIVIQKTNVIETGGHELTDSFYVLTPESIQLIKPYIKDSLIKKYSCCPEKVTGFLIEYDNGTQFRKSTIAADGGLFGYDYDTNYCFIVPHHYQHRIQIPKDTWKLILIDCIKVKKNK